MRKTVNLSGKQIDDAIAMYLGIEVDRICEMNHYEDGYSIEYEDGEI